MNAPLTPRQVATRMHAAYDHHGLPLDLYGHIDEDGYSVTFVTIAGSDTCIPVDADLRSYMAAWCDDHLPTAEELRREHAAEARAERAAWDRSMIGYALASIFAVTLFAPIADAATITSRPGASAYIRIETCPRFAGAICSLVAGRTKHAVAEHVNISDHGRQCQSAISLDYQGEGRNPTEAGSMRDGAGPTSTSKLLYEIVDGQRLHTQTQMAYWYPWQGQKLSNYVLEKRVQIGYAGMDNVIEYLTEYSIPRGEVAGHAVFEALTCYMPTYFSQFLTYDRGRIAPLDFTPGEQPLPIIAQTYGGIYAMGIYSPDSPQQEYKVAGYGRWRHPDTTKWNNVFRVNNPSGTYKFRSYIIVGTTAEVQESMRKLHDIFGSQK